MHSRLAPPARRKPCRSGSKPTTGLPSARRCEARPSCGQCAPPQWSLRFIMRSIPSAMAMSSAQASWGSTGVASAEETMSLPLWGLQYQLSPTSDHGPVLKVEALRHGHHPDRAALRCQAHGSLRRRVTQHTSPQAPAALMMVVAIRSSLPHLTCHWLPDRLAAVSGADNSTRPPRALNILR